MPVVTSVKCGCELARRRHIRIAVQNMTDFVLVLLLDARQRQFCEPFCCLSSKVGAVFVAAAATDDISSRIARKRFMPVCDRNRSCLTARARGKSEPCKFVSVRW